MAALLDILRGHAERAAAGIPALIMRAEAIAASISHGEHSRHRVGAGEKFWQFRAYDPSDRPQDIDWRQSAKGRHVFVREKELQTPQKVMFWCSATAGMEYSSDPSILTKHETGLVLCLTLALLTTRAGEQIGALGGKRPGRSELALQNLAENLLGKADFGSLPDAAALPLNAGLVMAGDFLGDPEDIRATFEALQGRTRQVMVIQILDPAEAELPFEGRAVFRAPGLDPHEPIKIEHIGEIRAAYKARIEAHRAALEALCHEYGWRYVYHRTDRDMARLAASIWEETVLNARGGLV